MYTVIHDCFCTLRSELNVAMERKMFTRDHLTENTGSACSETAPDAAAQGFPNRSCPLPLAFFAVLLLLQSLS